MALCDMVLTVCGVHRVCVHCVCLCRHMGLYFLFLASGVSLLYFICKREKRKEKKKKQHHTSHMFVAHGVELQFKTQTKILQK